MGRLSRFLLLIVAFLSACGPVSYLTVVAHRAARAVKEAKAVNAEKLAPYEYWSATEYLRMAREKAAYAYYELAYDYGKKAEDMAKAAQNLATGKMIGGKGKTNSDIDSVSSQKVARDTDISTKSGPGR